MSSRASNIYSGAVSDTVVTLAAAGPQNIRILTFLNTTAAVAYLQIFNMVGASVVLGTTTPTLSIGVPASAGIVFPISEQGVSLGGSGMSIAGTTTRAGSTAAILHVNIGYGG